MSGVLSIGDWHAFGGGEKYTSGIHQGGYVNSLG
jgi:hypothetical protein